MKTFLVLILFGLLLTFIPNVYAQSISAPSISSPSSGSSFTQGTSFTLSAEVSCSGPQGTTCQQVSLTANLPSGLSTSSTNPSLCGDMLRGTSCSKSWAVNANVASTYSITVTASGTNVGSKTSAAISVTVTQPAPSPEPAQAPTPTAAPTATAVTVTIENPKENQTFKRGDTILVKAKSSSSVNLIAELNTTSVKLFDDGEHQDDKLNDGIYANNLTVYFLEKGLYELKIRVDEIGYAGESSIKILIDPTLKILSEYKKEYFKGQDIIFSGKTLDVNNKSISNSTINVSVSYSDFQRSITTKTDANGNFSQNYYVGFLDPEGNWSLRIDARDTLGNSGFLTSIIPVKTPPEAAFYYIKFTTPLIGLTYTRGDKIPISVEVSEGSMPVSDANLSFRVPSGEILDLKESAPGVYTGEYVLGFDEPYGNHTIEVFGYKTENKILKGGTGVISLNVNPAKLKMELLSPQIKQFTAGQKVKITTRISYPDGTLGRNLLVSLSGPLNESVSFSEIEPGVYQTVYKLKKGEEGPWVMQLEARDQHDNSGIIKQVVQVNPITIFYLILTYWYFVAVGISPFAYLGYKISNKYFQKSRVKSHTEELNRIKKMKKDAQIKYFKEGSIDRGTYKKLLEEYEKRQEEVRSKLAKLKK